MTTFDVRSLPAVVEPVAEHGRAGGEVLGARPHPGGWREREGMLFDFPGLGPAAEEAPGRAWCGVCELREAPAAGGVCGSCVSGVALLLGELEDLWAGLPRVLRPSAQVKRVMPAGGMTGMERVVEVCRYLGPGGAAAWMAGVYRRLCLLAGLPAEELPVLVGDRMRAALRDARVLFDLCGEAGRLDADFVNGVIDYGAGLRAAASGKPLRVRRVLCGEFRPGGCGGLLVYEEGIGLPVCVRCGAALPLAAWWGWVHALAEKLPSTAK